MVSTPITLGRALLTLALPAAVLGGVLGAGGARLAEPSESPAVAVALAAPDTAADLSGQAVDAGADTPPVNSDRPQEPAASEAPDEHVPDDGSPRSPRGRDTLTQESRLIDGARIALSRGDAESCATFVAQHRRRFPEGALVEEREALDVRCRRVAGDPNAAAAAGAFRDRFPGSPQLGSHE